MEQGKRFLWILLLSLMIVPLMTFTVFADEEVAEEDNNVEVEAVSIMAQADIIVSGWENGMVHNGTFFITLSGGSGQGEFYVENVQGCIVNIVEGDTYQVTRFTPLEPYSITVGRNGDEEYDSSQKVTLEGRATYGDGLNKFGDRYSYCDPESGEIALREFIEIEGKIYYFNDKGWSVHSRGISYVGQYKYYFNGDGTIAKGIVEENGKTYCFNENGQQVVSDFATVDGKQYYFGADGAKVMGHGLAYVGSTQYYFNEDGSISKGLITIEGKDYYFNEASGTMAKSTFINVGDFRYYFNAQGIRITYQGFGYVGNGKYYFDPNSSVVRGAQSINGEVFAFHEITGRMQSSVFTDLGDQRYYIGSDGRVSKHIGFGYVGTDKYYFNGDGTIARGIKVINGIPYSFHEETGRILTSTFANIGGKRYYIGANGQPTPHIGFGYVGTDKYYFNGDGSVLRGNQIVNGKAYSFDENTGKLRTSIFVNIGDQRYYIGDSGQATAHIGFGYVGTDKYYFNGDGSVARGVHEINGKAFAFNEETGILYASTFANIEGKRYYIGSNGHPTPHIGFGYVGTDKYYFNGDGSVLRGNQIVNGKAYSFDENTGKLHTSIFVNIGDQRYYIGANGEVTPHVGFGYVGTDKYYFNGNGAVATGKQVINGKTYYFNPDTGILSNGELTTIDGVTYYLDENGNPVTGIVYIGKYKYVFLPDGALDKGYFKGNQLFYTNGTIDNSKWIKRNGHIYYMDSNGEVTNGRTYVGGDQYWFVGGVAKTGSQKINEIFYEFSEDGVYIPRVYNRIAEIAMSQIGHVGGYKYWTWYGWPYSVEWCACFVSWCANEGGYIGSGAVPKYAYCPSGVNWFKNHGDWIGRSPSPRAGDIIFFQWEGDYEVGHTGIVIRCENGRVYTMEGNTDKDNDYESLCTFNSYSIDSPVIAGYGRPRY